MNQELSKAVSVEHVAASVVFSGEKITVPEKMTIPQAITTLEQFAADQEKEVPFFETFNVFPWDGANGLRIVLDRRFGWVNYQGAEVQQEVGPNESKKLPWGSFKVPALNAVFKCDATRLEGRWVFQVRAFAKKKAEQEVNEVFKDLRKFFQDGGSIYQGKAIRLQLTDDDGDTLSLPIPKFIDVDAIDTSAMIYNDDVHEMLEVNLFTPIRRIEDLKASGLPVKRATLLSGTFGTGKTLAASAAAKMCVKEGITYIYISKASDLALAVMFAKMYSSPACMIFCEDVDREMSGDRTASMDSLLNVIDGLDTKASNIMIVLTTNDVRSINPAMLRPGRLDAVIEITAPDAKTAAKILRKYCGSALSAEEDLTEVGRVLAGQIPATLAEVVKKAKLSSLSLQPKGTTVTRLTAAGLLISAKMMAGQLKLLQEQIDAETPRSQLIREELEKKALAVLREGNGAADGMVHRAVTYHLDDLRAQQ